MVAGGHGHEGSARLSEPWQTHSEPSSAGKRKAVVRTAVAARSGLSESTSEANLLAAGVRASNRIGPACRCTVMGVKTWLRARLSLRLANQSSQAAQSKRCWISSISSVSLTTAEVAATPAEQEMASARPPCTPLSHRLAEREPRRGRGAHCSGSSEAAARPALNATRRLSGLQKSPCLPTSGRFSGRQASCRQPFVLPKRNALVSVTSAGSRAGRRAAGGQRLGVCGRAGNVTARRRQERATGGSSSDRGAKAGSQ